MSATPNPMTDTLRAHTSVRAFTDEPVSQEDLEAIYESARAASSTCFLQVTTVIRITDKELKAKLAELAGNQKHIIAAPEFWVFCADYHRDPRAEGGSRLDRAADCGLRGCRDSGSERLCRA